MNKHIQSIQHHIEPLRQEIMNHKVYQSIENLEDLQIFMQYHVYAVWDFMSLLKALQNNLTCTTLPWLPKGSAHTRYLINEIVLGEESDDDMNGKKTSHFELYINAMKQCGADYYEIEQFINALKQGKTLRRAFAAAGTAGKASDFVNFTFDIIKENKDYVQAAVFTFGREDLIPGMFRGMINDMHLQSPGSISIFKYYLERHIEVDGDHHSRLALQMTTHLCGKNELRWKEAESAVHESLKKRIELWNGAYEKIVRRRKAHLA